jgi:uncharacterized protein (TIGR01777 family)
MKILITGATGLVGTALIHQLQEEDVSLHFLTTRSNQLDRIPNAKGFLWDPANNEMNPACWEGVTHLIHLAGTSISIPWTVSNRKKILESRVHSTNLLAQSLKEQKHTLRTVVAASAVGIYPSSITTEYSENAAPGTGFLADVVTQWETAVNALSNHAQVVIKLRTGLVLSRKGGVLPTLALPVNFGIGAAFGSGKQGQSWIHLSDLAGLFVFALTQEQSAVYNAVAPNPVSQNELIKALGRYMKRPVFLPNIPAFLMRMVLGQRSALVLGSQYVKADAVQQQGFQFEYPTLEMALHNLYPTK